MLKTAALFLFLTVPAAAPLRAQQAARAVVMVIDEYDNEVRYNLALWHAVQLKKAGVDVSILFESEGVLNFLPDKGGRLAKKDPNAVRLSAPRNKGRHRNSFGAARGAALLTELKGLGVPMSACALSAVFFGEYEALKAAGAPLTADPERPANLSALMKPGAQVLVF